MDLWQMVLKTRHVMLELRRLRAVQLARDMQLIVHTAVALQSLRPPERLSRYPYRERYAWLIETAPVVLAAAEAAYPGITRLPPALPPARPEQRRTVRVSITLEADDWQLIDKRIRSGFARSRADYFRRLHNDKSTFNQVDSPRRGWYS